MPATRHALVGKVGVEPTHLTIPDLKSGAAANYATRPYASESGFGPKLNDSKSLVLPLHYSELV